MKYSIRYKDWYMRTARRFTVVFLLGGITSSLAYLAGVKTEEPVQIAIIIMTIAFLTSLEKAIRDHENDEDDAISVRETNK